VTDVGTVALEELYVRATMTPPAGAATFSVTVPVETAPHTTAFGAKTTLMGTGGVSTSTPVVLLPDDVAERVTVVFAPTTDVDAEKDTVVEPWGTVTVAGTETSELLLFKLIIVPDGGAAPLVVTTPVLTDPPMTEGGENVRPMGMGGLTVRVAETEVPPPDAVTCA